MKQSQNPVWNVSLVKYVMSSALRRECQQPSVCLHLSRVTTGLDYTTNEYLYYVIHIAISTCLKLPLTSVNLCVNLAQCDQMWWAGPKNQKFEFQKIVPLEIKDVSKCGWDTNNLPDLPKFKTVLFPSFRRKWKGQLILPKVQIWLPYYPNSRMSEMWVLQKRMMKGWLDVTWFQ